MTKLTAKQENFARKYVECGNASEAYRTAYNVGEDTLPKTATEEACRILADHNVTAMVISLQEEANERTQVTVESLCVELDEARAMAVATKQPAAMTGASMGKAKLHGLDVKKVEFVNPITVQMSKADEGL